MSTKKVETLKPNYLIVRTAQSFLRDAAKVVLLLFGNDTVGIEYAAMETCNAAMALLEMSHVHQNNPYS